MQQQQQLLLQYACSMLAVCLQYACVDPVTWHPASAALPVSALCLSLTYANLSGDTLGDPPTPFMLLSTQRVSGPVATHFWTASLHASTRVAVGLLKLGLSWSPRNTQHKESDHGLCWQGKCIMMHFKVITLK